MSVSETEMENVYDNHIALLQFMLKWHSYEDHQHPDFTEDLWREVVCSGHTLEGYWEWAYELDLLNANKGIAE